MKLSLSILSDTHGEFPQPSSVPSADLLIHCGDWTNWGLANEQGLGEVEKARRWVAALKPRFGHMLGIPGNHDIGMNAPEFEALGVIPLDGRTWAHPSGLRFHGVGLTAPFTHPEWMEVSDHVTLDPETELQAWEFAAVDVVVAHAPPWNHCDPLGPHRIGTQMGLLYLRRHRPRLYLCGHAHEGSGESQEGQTRIINAAKRVAWIEIEV
jgi:Icc-related predicted phosphoesterase